MRHKKLHPRSLNLVEIGELHSICKKHLKLSGSNLGMLISLLYKTDVSKFNRAYKIIYGVDNSNEPIVAQLLLKFGFEHCKLLEFVAMISKQVKDV